MEYRASVRSANPIRHTIERTTSDLQEAKDWAESQKKRIDDIAEVVGVSHFSSMESVSQVWRLVDGRWIDASVEQN